MKLLPLVALCLGFFIVIMDVTIVNVALPSIAISLHTTISWLQWIVAAYTLSFAGLLLTAGHLGDQYGEKYLFQCGVGLFAMTSLTCGLSTSALWLTIFRLLQGISAAFIVPTSLALINATYTDHQSRAKAIGIWGAIGGIAAATGPVLGAVLTTLFNWRAVFFVNVPISIICILLTIKYTQVNVRTKKIAFDFTGQLFAIITIAVLAFGLIEAGRLGWLALPVIIALVIFIFASIIFIIIEKNLEQPMLPLTFFKNRYFSFSLLVGLIMNLGFYGELFVLPLYFQHIRDYSVMKTGLALFPLMAMVALSSYLSGKMSSNVEPKWPMLIGLGISTFGFVSLLIITTKAPAYWIFIVPFAMMGFGIAFAMPAATLIIMHAVSKDKKGIASGAFNASRQIGSLVGVALFGTIITTAASFTIGMQLTLIIAATVFLVTGLGTAFLI